MRQLYSWQMFLVGTMYSEITPYTNMLLAVFNHPERALQVVKSLRQFAERERRRADADVLAKQVQGARGRPS